MKALISLIISLFVTTAAWAEAPYLPALYDVSGVAAGDVLNLRAGPGVKHPVVGRYARNQRRISVLQLSDDSNWGLVAHGEGRAWVAMHSLMLQPRQVAGQLPEPLFCGGTEPGWDLSLDQGRAVFSDYDGKGPELRLRWQGVADGMQPYFYGVRLADDSHEINAVITRDLCSDGMSDRPHGFSINAILSGDWGNRMVTGCCSLR